MLFTDRFPLSIFIIISGSRMWAMSEAVDLSQSTWFPDEKPTLVSDGCDPKVGSGESNFRFGDGISCCKDSPGFVTRYFSVI
ncbi:hypothetical protein OROMI_003257 [Orobanche minor]